MKSLHYIANSEQKFPVVSYPRSSRNPRRFIMYYTWLLYYHSYEQLYLYNKIKIESSRARYSDNDESHNDPVHYVSSNIYCTVKDNNR